jgi:23S rRNA (uracil1939-C5)-methyltransferase
MSSANNDITRLHKGQVLTAVIESLEPGGCGVCRVAGMPVFVNRTAAGDLVEMKVFDVRKTFARAQLLRVLEPSPQRAEPPCKLFKVCGGCQWQHLGYQWQLEAKRDIVRQAIKHIGRMEPDLVKPVVPAQQPLFYRNKVQFPVSQPQNSSRILAGYYEQDSHDLVNIKHCPVQPEPLDRLLEAVKAIAEKHGVTAYDETRHQGFLRHITARYSFDRQSILLTLVVNCSVADLPMNRLQQLAREIQEQVPEITGVLVNCNSSKGNRIFGEQTISISGESHLIERLSSTRPDRHESLRQGLQFQLSPTSFFQVNTSQAVELLELVMDGVLSFGHNRIPLLADTYAGVGTIAMWLSPVAEKVLAVEEFPQAVADGQVNLQLNDIQNVEFQSGSVEQVLATWVKEGLKPDVMVLDPPRKGISPEAMEQIVKLQVAGLVYVSCNPATLARDLKILQENGYKTKEIQPLDMFPQTYHVESVAVLER